MEHLDASRGETLLHLFVFFSASSVYFKLQIICYLQLGRYSQDKKIMKLGRKGVRIIPSRKGCGQLDQQRRKQGRNHLSDTSRDVWLEKSEEIDASL
jgi:hypothetical protein